MRKKNKKAQNNLLIKPENAIEFLEDLRNLSADINEPTQAISLRVPRNLLRSIKLKAKLDGKKYQSLMIEILRSGIRKNNKT